MDDKEYKDWLYKVTYNNTDFIYTILHQNYSTLELEEAMLQI